MDITKSIEALRPRLVAQARAARLSVEDAEDAAAEVVVNLWKARERLDLATLDRYASRSMTRHLVDRARMESRRPQMVLACDAPEEYAGIEDSLADEAAEEIGGSEAFRAVMALPRAMRDAVLKVDVAGLTYEEYAADRHVAVGTVRSRLHRARTALRERLGACLN